MAKRALCGFMVALTAHGAAIAQAPAPPAANRPAARIADINACRPPYPPPSVAANETGVTQVRARVSAAGEVIEATVVRSSGHPRLDDATVAGLSACRFLPRMVDGVAVESSTTIDYEWRLEEPKPAKAPCAPQYPAESVRRGETGTTVLSFRVNANNRAEAIDIVRSSGFARLDAEAVRSLSECRFMLPPAAASAPQGRTTVEYLWKVQ